MITHIFGKKKNYAGFTLLEILVVISIISILVVIGVVSYSAAGKKARDAKRLADIKQIERGLVQYYAENGSYPEETTAEGNYFGWEASYISNANNFIESIQQYLGTVPLDPVNNRTNFYAYYNYPSGVAYGCSWSGPFSVLAISKLEATDTTNIPKAQCTLRDWSTSFNYSKFFIP